MKTKMVLFILIVILISACQSAPDRKSYICDECYISMDCLYRMKSEKDKSICAALIEACRDAMKEHRYIERLKYCKENKPENMTERECRLWINQK